MNEEKKSVEPRKNEFLPRKVNWWNAAAATATGAVLLMAQHAATGVAGVLQGGDADAKKIGKAALAGALIGFAGWAFPTFKKPDEVVPPVANKE